MEACPGNSVSIADSRCLYDPLVESENPDTQQKNTGLNERDPVGVENGLVVSSSTLRIRSILGSEKKIDLEDVQCAHMRSIRGRSVDWEEEIVDRTARYHPLCTCAAKKW